MKEPTVAAHPSNPDTQSTDAALCRQLGESWSANLPELAWDSRSFIETETRSADAQSWHIVRSRSRQEKLIAEFLENNSIGFYMPMIRVERKYAHRMRVTDQPLFNGYVFLFGTRDDTFKLLGTKRASQVLQVPDQVRFARELSHIRQAIDAGQTLELFPGLKPGTLVRVTRGTLEGLTGVVIDESRPGWVHLQVHVLGQSACVEVSPASLEVIPPDHLPASEMELKQARPGGLSSTLPRKAQTA
ncbi:MAG: hypothetical protein H6815_11230 [Phycisphaeraceae bacterium]|nr:hypothetical protein [Phycisphaerales bacterium]MCB9861009.1 hypothetical protein [Phycisphaeraceae bacterium]